VVASAAGSMVRSATISWHHWLGGQFWVGGYWYGSPAYFAFITDVCGLKLDPGIIKQATAYRKICESVNYIWPNTYFVMVCARPSKIQLQAGRLHCETGRAIEYPDGWGLYSLNGVTVPEWLVITPSEKLDVSKALTEKNADIQREIIRKIGPDRLLVETNAKTLDDFTEPNTGYTYSLKTMQIGDNIDRRYLYFEHASMPGVFYAKPVPPECKKALHARAWILSMAEREKLGGVTVADEAQFIANLPQFVS